MPVHRSLLPQVSMYPSFGYLLSRRSPSKSDAGCLRTIRRLVARPDLTKADLACWRE